MSDQSPFASRWLLGPGPDRVKFYTRLYTLPAPASPHALIVFVHGYDEHIGRHERVHTRVAERGVAVFAWDQRGFGRTALGNLEQDEGTESGSGAYGRTGDSNTVMRDVRWAIDTARRFVPADTPVFLWGHSMVRSFLAGSHILPEILRRYAHAGWRYSTGLRHPFQRNWARSLGRCTCGCSAS